MLQEFSPNTKLFWIFTKKTPIQVFGAESQFIASSHLAQFDQDIRLTLDNNPYFSFSAILTYRMEGYFLQLFLEVQIEHTEQQLEMVSEFIARIQAVALLTDQIESGLAINTKIAQTSHTDQNSQPIFTRVGEIVS